MPEIILHGTHLSRVYQTGSVTVHALRDATFEIREREFVVVLGPSGSGKLTLLNLLGGMDQPSGGKLHYRDKDLGALSKEALTMYRRQAAPFPGIVRKLLVETGTFVQENQPVAQIYQDGEMKIETVLTDEDVLSLHQGDVAQCRLQNGKTFEAKISFISPAATDRVSSVGITESRRTVELRADPFPAALGAGSRIDVSFTSTTLENVFSVPSGAIVPDGTGSAVYLLTNGRLRLTPVQLGLRAGNRVEITKGLSKGDRVVIDPYLEGIRNGKRAAAAK